MKDNTNGISAKFDKSVYLIATTTIMIIELHTLFSTVYPIFSVVPTLVSPILVALIAIINVVLTVILACKTKHIHILCYLADTIYPLAVYATLVIAKSHPIITIISFAFFIMQLVFYYAHSGKNNKSKEKLNIALDIKTMLIYATTIPLIAIMFMR